MYYASVVCRQGKEGAVQERVARRRVTDYNGACMRLTTETVARRPRPLQYVSIAGITMDATFFVAVVGVVVRGECEEGEAAGKCARLRWLIRR